MITLTYFFWILVIIFAVIGAMRGWAQELLVAFSVILGLFIIRVLEFIPFVNGILETGYLDANTGIVVPITTTTFWVRTSIILLFAFFGYQSPRIQRIARGGARKERFQDTVLGILVGGLNGYLIIGTIWFFLIQASYFPEFITPPLPTDQAAQTIINILPPILANGNSIFFAIAIAFAFVVIVFV
jgi:hypothetical protein